MKYFPLLLAFLISSGLFAQAPDRARLESLTEQHWQAGLRLLNEIISMPNDAVFP